MAVGMAGDIGRWQAGQQRYLQSWQKMVADLQKAKTLAAAEISPEYQQAADIYKTGGEYGAGARTAILEREKAGVASGQAGLVSSGMSSGSLAAGVKARYSREAQGQLQQVEDIRYERLGSALSALGAAKTARGERMTQSYMTSAQMLGGYKEPGVSEFTSSEQMQINKGYDEIVAEMVKGRYT